MSIATTDDPSREWTEAGRREYALLLVNDVLALSDATHPDKGVAAEVDKDLKAWTALVRMRELTETIAGWAINHQTGLAVEGLRALSSLASADINENPEYDENLSRLNSHEREQTGKRVYEETEKLSPLLARKILTNILSANPGGFNFDLNRMLVQAMQALEFGETLPILKRVESNRKVQWQDLQHQLRAISLIEYRNTRGMKKRAAQEDVARAYGMSADAVRGWEHAVRAALGNLQVHEEIASARHAALLEEKAKRSGGKGSTPAGYFDRHYGADALRRAGEEYLAFKRSKKQD